MITKYKIFEKLNAGVSPKVGYYVIIEPTYYRNMIGMLRRIKRDDKNSFNTKYYIWFPDISDAWFDFFEDEILYWSIDRKDLEKVLREEKFGL